MKVIIMAAVGWVNKPRGCWWMMGISDRNRSDPVALARLEPVKGRTVQGVGFDQKVLIEAGIEHADAFAAASSMDNITSWLPYCSQYVSCTQSRGAVVRSSRAEIYRRLG